ncbi:M20/M25/M40 family metallo-hydrolase, partial [bacterium]|nr:M20/M25/M40 family metallo-hydrolase [bacterium]
NECFETAFSVSIGKGKPHIGLIAELDALPTLGHKYANKNDNNAAHACGHSSQCAIMASVISLLKEDTFKGKVTLFFTPAEEYTDIKVLGILPELVSHTQPDEIITNILNGIDIESVFNVKIEKLDFN